MSIRHKNEKLPLDFQLYTKRCRLRLPDAKDTPHVFSATRHAGFNDGMRWDPPGSVEELLESLEKNLEAWRVGEAFTFTIENRTDFAFVGRISLRRTATPRVWNLGFWTHPKFQRQGFMKEAAKAVIDFGFDTLNAEAIEACHAVWNTPSRRVLERIGMSEVEYVPQGFQKRGVWVPEYRMRIEKKQISPEYSSQATPLEGRG